MKIICSIVVLLFAVLFQAKAQSEKKATVYLLRADGPDSYVPYYTYLGDTLLCKLGNGMFSQHQVDTGVHKMHTQYRGKMKHNPETELTVNFEAGKIYYISVNLKTRAFARGTFYCEQLSEADGKTKLGGLIEHKKCL